MFLRIHKVRGQSMSPSFFHNDYALSFQCRFTRYRVGDVVIARHPDLGVIIKRIAEVDGQRNVRLVGDSPCSTSSQAMGWLVPAQLLGKVWWRVTDLQWR